MSDHAQAAPTSVDVQKFQGGKSWLGRSAIVGLVGLGATFAGMATNPAAAFPAYLVAFAYWGGVAFASLLLLMTVHAFRAKWPTIVRRPLEVMAVSIAPFLLLFIPIAAGGMGTLYSWVHPADHSFTAEGLRLLEHKKAYLNVPAWIIRSVGYFVFAILVSQLLFKASTKQDESGDLALTVRQRKLGTGLLPFVGLAMTFAGFDWLMSLEPLWFSTIYGAYYFAGSTLATMAIIIIATVWGRGKDNFGGYVSIEHLHNLGKLLFAFTAFWGYIAVSQFLLIWIANLPEETPFYLARMLPAWKGIGIFLIIGHFFVPFGILLSRDIKRKPQRLVFVALYALFIHFVDVYWLVMPTFAKDSIGFHWTHVTAFFGVGGVVIASAIWRIRGHYTVPVKDPFLAASLRYRQP